MQKRSEEKQGRRGAKVRRRAIRQSAIKNSTKETPLFPKRARVRRRAIRQSAIKNSTKETPLFPKRARVRRSAIKHSTKDGWDSEDYLSLPRPSYFSEDDNRYFSSELSKEITELENNDN
jgi:hypothetical protein